MRTCEIVTFTAACLLAGAQAVKNEQSMWWMVDDEDPQGQSSVLPLETDTEWWEYDKPLG